MPHPTHKERVLVNPLLDAGPVEKRALLEGRLHALHQAHGAAGVQPRVDVAEAAFGEMAVDALLWSVLGIGLEAFLF